MTNTLAVCVWLLAAAWHSDSVVSVDNNTTHDGIVISASAGKLVMAKSGGREVSYPIGENTRISRNGEPARLEDFKAGDAVRVIVDEQGAAVALSTVDVDKRQAQRVEMPEKLLTRRGMIKRRR